MAVSFSIEKKIGTISEKSSGWAKELNMVKWSNNSPKYDIREWDPSHTSMGKGVTFTRDELEQLYLLLRDMFETDQPLKRLLYAVPRAWTDLDHFKKLLLEYYPSDKRKRNLLLVSAEEGIPERLAAMEICFCNDMDELTQCLMDACGCKEQYAEEIVTTWAEALGLPLEEGQDKESSSSGADLNMGIVEPDIGFGKRDCLGQRQVFLLVCCRQFSEMNIKRTVVKAFLIQIASCDTGKAISGNVHPAGQLQHILSTDHCYCHSYVIFFHHWTVIYDNISLTDLKRMNCKEWKGDGKGSLL